MSQGRKGPGQSSGLTKALRQVEEVPKGQDSAPTPTTPPHHPAPAPPAAPRAEGEKGNVTAGLPFLNIWLLSSIQAEQKQKQAHPGPLPRAGLC